MLYFLIENNTYDVKGSSINSYQNFPDTLFQFERSNDWEGISSGNIGEYNKIIYDAVSSDIRDRLSSEMMDCSACGTMSPTNLPCSGYWNVTCGMGISGGIFSFKYSDMLLPHNIATSGMCDDGKTCVNLNGGNFVIRNTSGHWALNEMTDVVYGKIIKSKTFNLLEPDQVQSSFDKVPIFPVESDEFLSGIVISKVFLKTSSNCTMDVGVEKWSDPVGTTSSTVTTVSLSASNEGSVSPTGSVTEIDPGYILMANLDTTDVDWLQLHVLYYEPA